MPTTDTRARILDAAERIFTDAGLEGFSLRAVTAAAGVNVAAVNYHFGSKAALLRALVRQVFATVHVEQARLLDALEAATPQPEAAAVLNAYATPIFALFDTAHAREWGRVWIAAREADDPSRERAPMQFADTALTRRYGEALRLALPDLPSDELWWRFERANNLLMANRGMRAMAAGGEDGENAPSAERRWLLTFLVGALKAPASGAQRAAE